ncbi:MAG TPA: VOC family protein [Cyclobacteriaceae bacterium]
MKSDRVQFKANTVTPMLAVKDAEAALTWYTRVFQAVEVLRLRDPQNGTVAHAELHIGEGRIMIAEEHPDYNRSPSTLHGSSVILHIYVPNVDEVVVRAVKEGAKLIFPVRDQFYGERSGRFEDPFGHLWIVSTLLREIPPGEMQRLFNEMMLRNELKS